MTIDLAKGQRIDLQKEAPGSTHYAIELGWTAPGDYDLDTQAFLCDVNGKLLEDPGFVFYGNLQSPDGAVVHSGDVRGEGGAQGGANDPDEVITVDTAKLDPRVDSVVFTITIHEAAQKGQNFGQCRPAWVRISDKDTGVQIAKYDLDEDASTATALIFSRLYKRDGIWKYEGIGQAAGADLRTIVNQFRSTPLPA